MTVQEIIQSALEARTEQRAAEIAERREYLEGEREKYERLIDQMDLKLIVEALTVYTTTVDENPSSPPDKWYTRLRVPTKLGDGTLGYLKVSPFNGRLLSMTAEGTCPMGMDQFNQFNKNAIVGKREEFLAFLGEAYNIFEVKAAVAKSKS